MIDNCFGFFYTSMFVAIKVGYDTILESKTDEIVKYIIRK